MNIACRPEKQEHQFAKTDILERHIFEQHFDDSGNSWDATSSNGDGSACGYRILAALPRFSALGTLLVMHMCLMGRNGSQNPLFPEI